MNNKDYSEMVSSLVDGEPHPKHDQPQEEHLITDEQCAEKLHAYHANKQLLAGMTSPKVSESFTSRLNTQIKNKKHRNIAWWPVSIAASTVLATLLVWQLVEFTPLPDKAPIQRAELFDDAPSIEEFSNAISLADVSLTMTCKSVSEGGACTFEKRHESNSG